MSDEDYYAPVCYNTPEDYFLPDPQNLEDDTQHPEANSFDFQYRIYSEKCKGQAENYCDFFTHIENTDKVFIVATNSFNTAYWNGNVIGTHRENHGFEPIVAASTDKACFVLPFDSNVTGLKLNGSHLFFVTLANNELFMYNCHSYYRVGRLTTNGRIDSAMDNFKEHHKAVVGTNKGSVYLLDHGTAELVSERYIEHAHANAITGVSCHPSSNEQWVTSSTDHNVVMWDKRQSPAGLRLLKNYDSQLTAVHWTTQDENKQLVIVGDEVGNILTLDPRKPNKIVNMNRIAKRSIMQLSFNGTKTFGVVPKYNEAIILQADDKGDVNTIRTHTADGMIYQMTWDVTDNKTFFVVGEEKYAERVKLE